VLLFFCSQPPTLSGLFFATYGAQTHGYLVCIHSRRRAGSACLCRNGRQPSWLFTQNKRALLIGQKLAAGPQAVNVPVLVGSTDQAKALFGVGSMLARMHEDYPSARSGWRGLVPSCCRPRRWRGGVGHDHNHRSSYSCR